MKAHIHTSLKVLISLVRCPSGMNLTWIWLFVCKAMIKTNKLLPKFNCLRLMYNFFLSAESKAAPKSTKGTYSFLWRYFIYLFIKWFIRLEGLPGDVENETARVYISFWVLNFIISTLFWSIIAKANYLWNFILSCSEGQQSKRNRRPCKWSEIPRINLVTGLLEAYTTMCSL